MATAQQQLSQIQQLQQQLSEAQQQTQQARLQQTRQQLLSATPQLQAQRKVQFAQQKQQALAELQKTGAELSQYKQQLQEYLSKADEIANLQHDLTVAQRYVSRGRFPFSESSRVKQLYQSEAKRQLAQQDFITGKKELQEFQAQFPGEKLIFNKAGQLMGIESGTLGQSVDIGKYQQALKDIPATAVPEVSLPSQIPAVPQPTETLFSKFFMGAKIEETPFAIGGKIIKGIKEGLQGTAPPYQQQFFELTKAKGQDAISFLEQKKSDVGEFVMPPSSQEVILRKEAERLSEAQSQLNRQIEEYNLGNLPSSDYDKLQQQQQTLDAQRQYIEARQKAEQQRFETTPFSFFGSAVSEFATTPLSAGQLGIGLFIAPTETLKEQYTAVKSLPSTFAQQPFTTAGSLLGGFAGYELLGRVGSPLLREAETTTKTTTIKPKVSSNIILSDAVYLGDNQWYVSSKVQTKVYNAKTGKLLDTVDTIGKSYAVTSATEEGAVRGVADTIASSIGKYGERFYPDQLKLTKKYNIAKAQSTITLKPTDAAGFEGVGESVINELGIAQLKRTPAVLQGVLRKYKVQPESTALSNIKIKLIDEMPSEFGTVSTSKGLILTDIYEDLLGIKGYKKVTGKRVQPYLRKQRVDVRFPISERALSFEMARALYPESFPIDLGGLEINPSEIGSLALKRAMESTAQASALSGMSGIVKGIEKKALKPIIKIKTEVSPTAKLLSATAEDMKVLGITSTPQVTVRGITSPATLKTKQLPKQDLLSGINVDVAERNLLGQKQEQQSRELQKPAEVNLLFNPQSFKESLKELQKTKQKVSQAQRLEQRQTQQQRQMQILQLVQPSRARAERYTTTTKKIPKKIIPFFLKKEKLSLGKIGKRGELFTAQIKRYGKWKDILKTSKYERALFGGIKITKETLGASVRVLKGGKPIRITPPKTFRYSKKNPFVIVQRREERLGTPGERREIRLARIKKIKL